MNDRPFRSAALGMPPLGVVVEVRWPEGAIGKTKPSAWTNTGASENAVASLDIVEHIKPNEVVLCYSRMLTDGGGDIETQQLGLVWARESDGEVILGDGSEWRPVHG